MTQENMSLHSKVEEQKIDIKLSSRVEDDEPINLIYPLIILAKNKKKIIFAPIIAAIFALGLSFLIPNKYTGTAQILPPQSQSGASVLLGQLGGLGTMAGSSLGLKNPSDIYIGMLSSRTMQDSIIERFKLKEIYDTKLISDTRKKLINATRISTAKNGLIVVEYENEDAILAANLTNAYIEELQKLTQVFAVTEASQRRQFFEKQLSAAKQSLADAEVALKQVQEKTGLIKLEGQADAIIKSAAEFKAQIASREVALSAMKTFATADNPNYKRTEQEIAALRLQLKKIETGLNQGGGDISVSTSNVPEVGLEYIRRVRDVKYYEAIFELLAKQFELAKIDEAKEGSVLQVLDKAIVPDKKSSPDRAIIVITVFFLFGFFVIFWAFIREIFSVDKNNVEKEEQIKLLKNSLKWKI